MSSNWQNTLQLSAEDLKQVYKAHGYKDDTETSSSSNESFKDFDEKYYALKPPDNSFAGPLTVHQSAASRRRANNIGKEKETVKNNGAIPKRIKNKRTINYQKNKRILENKQEFKNPNNISSGNIQDKSGKNTNQLKKIHKNGHQHQVININPRKHINDCNWENIPSNSKLQNPKPGTSNVQVNSTKKSLESSLKKPFVVSASKKRPSNQLIHTEEQSITTGFADLRKCSFPFQSLNSMAAEALKNKRSDSKIEIQNENVYNTKEKHRENTSQPKLVLKNDKPPQMNATNPQLYKEWKEWETQANQVKQAKENKIPAIGINVQSAQSSKTAGAFTSNSNPLEVAGHPSNNNKLHEALQELKMNGNELQRVVTETRVENEPKRKLGPERRAPNITTIYGSENVNHLSTVNEMRQFPISHYENSTDSAPVNNIFFNICCCFSRNKDS